MRRSASIDYVASCGGSGKINTGSYSAHSATQRRQNILGLDPQLSRSPFLGSQSLSVWGTGRGIDPVERPSHHEQRRGPNESLFLRQASSTTWLRFSRADPSLRCQLNRPYRFRPALQVAVTDLRVPCDSSRWSLLPASVAVNNCASYPRKIGRTWIPPHGFRV